MSTHESESKRISPFTWRTGLAFAFALIGIQPAVMYLYLVTGGGLQLSTWMIILLWTEVARMFGKSITPQEVFLIMAFEYTAVGNVWIFINIIKNLYFGISPITAAFGLTPHIPSWWAPSGEMMIQALASRSLLSQPWILPIGILVFTSLLDLVASIALGHFCYELYAVVEELPFPFQAATAESIMTVSEREPERMRALMLSALIGAIYGILSYLLPFVTGSRVFQVMPRGWRDYSYLSEQILSGASLGIDATLTTFVTGFIIPLPVLIVAFLTSVGAYFLGNHFLFETGIWPEWNTGMSMITAIERSRLYFWVSFGIGLALAAAFVPLALRPQLLVGAFKGLRGSGGEGTKMWTLLAAFFAATLGSVLLVKVLVPAFPTWILILFSVGWSLFASFVSANAMGVGASASFNIPYLRESVIYFSGYRGVDIWFANYVSWGAAAPGAPAPPNLGLPLMSVGGASIAGYLKMSDLVGAKPSDYVKALVVITAGSWLMSAVFANIFWSAAPIPSSAYPYTITGWPVEVMDRNRWIRWLWSGILFKPDVILTSFVLGAVICVAGSLGHVAYIPIAMTMGIFTSMPIVISQLIGSAMGTLVLSKVLGEVWRRHRSQIVVGIMIGDSMIVTVVSAIQLMIKSQWLMPY